MMFTALTRVLGISGVAGSLALGVMALAYTPSAGAQTVRCYKETCIQGSSGEVCVKEEIECPSEPKEEEAT